MDLSTYFRSTAAYRVRIALNHKQLEHTLIPVNLLVDGGQQKTTEYLHKSPNGLVPILETDDGVLHQSLAIMEYLEEKYPANPILPIDLMSRAQVRAFSQSIACDIHPLNNLRVLQYLSNELKVSDEAKKRWYVHWVHLGFSALEARLNASSGTQFCFGNEITMADICLVPQVYNAIRFNCPMDEYPNIVRINDNCLELDAFTKSSPSNQPDAI
ncbi:MAG: maleylacetoacetate isomerase [Gammaproteobacteria bacterium]|nr:maleylacetoacetate isomerase [Gammaproteobacteria bacterium]